MQSAKRGNQDYQLWLRTSLSPRISFEFEEFEYKGSHIVIFEIPAATGEPVTFNGVAYIRINSNLTKLKGYTEYIRQIYSSQQDWSAQIVKDATLDDLDPAAIKRARELYKDKHPDLADDLPVKAQNLVCEWLETNYEKLLEMWNTQVITKLEPLK